MAFPSVSVLLPVRDAEPFLAEALASLSAQTLEDHEEDISCAIDRLASSMKGQPETDERAALLAG